MPTVAPIPPGYHTVTPQLVLRDGAKALDFYKKAFDAKERFRMAGPDGKLVHAEMQIGDSLVMLTDEMPQAGSSSPLTLRGTPCWLHLYVPDVDKVWKRAVDAGCTVKMPLEDQFWGDRYGCVEDPFGHAWSLATHTEDVSPVELARRSKEALAKAPQPADQRP